MVEKSSTTVAPGNNNPLDKSNNAIDNALNNIPQALDTLQTGNQTTKSTSSHASVLDTLVSTQTFELLPRAGSNVFQLACASLDVT